MEDIKPTDYKVGDLIEPKEQRYQHLKAKVVDITERGIVVQFIGSDNKGLIPHNQANLLTKCKAGTILYGDKDKKHSSS